MGPNTTGDIGDILCVWAHPDDEAYLSAGLMMRAIETGHRVVCVTATKGEAGFPDDDPRTVEERMAVRERELAALPHDSRHHRAPLDGLPRRRVR